MLGSFRTLRCSAILLAVAAPLAAQTRPAEFDSLLSKQFAYDPQIAVTVAAPGPEVAPQRALSYWVAVGDWARVAEVISALPPADAAPVHARIVAGVLETANNPFTDAPLSTPVQNKAINPGKPPATAWPSLRFGDQLQPQDVLDLADTLPGASTLQTGVAAQLGQLLAKTIGPAGIPDAVVQRLHQGTVHLGGTDPAHLPSTITFLMSAQLPDLAMTFLPDEKTIFQLNAPGDAMLYQLCLLASADAQRDPIVANQRRHTALRLTIAMLSRPTADPIAKPLVKLALDLADATGDHQAIDSWIGGLVARREPGLPIILQFLARPIPPAAGEPNYDLRLNHLTQQRRFVDMIAASAGEDQPYDHSLHAAERLFAMNWATEADFTRSVVSVPPREVTPGDARSFQRQFGATADTVKEIPADQLLSLEPAGNWENQIEPNDRQRFDIDRLCLLMADNRIEQAMELLGRMAKQDASADAEEKIAGTALSVWVFHNMSVRVAISAFQNSMPSTGIPTARATQERNLDTLVQILDQIRQAYGRPFPQPLLALLFDYIHSQAEVYRLDEIERVFGPVEHMDYDAVLQLYALMQKNLQKTWVSDQVQTANGTYRTDEQRVQQAMDAYHTLTTVMEKRTAVAPDWRLLTALANARFTEAEMGLKNHGGFAVYTGLRDSAFDAIHRAAAEYAKTVSAGDNGMETIDPFTGWFAMALGAADMASIHVDQVPAEGEMQRLHDALHALPPGAAGRHIDRFANLVADQETSLAPDVKERITRNALIVLGDAPSANPLRAILQSYADLIAELNFHVAVDGSGRVGDKEPFGLMVSMLHTDSLDAEVRGFGKYVLAQDQSMRSSNGQFAKVNYRANFEKHLHEALDKSFDIQNIVWAPDDVRPRSIDRPGWSETSLAYVVVRARDASVDRVPPVQIDVDFNDKMSTVILPVTSSSLVIDAASADARPTTALTIDQRLNDHDLSKGSLKLEVRASGRGLMPALNKLLNLSFSRLFTVANIVDRGAKPESFDTNPTDPGVTPTVLSSREWVVTLQTSGAITPAVKFQFPPVVKEYSSRTDVTTTYHRYDDADVIDAGATVMLHGTNAPVVHSRVFIILVSVLAICAVVVSFIVARFIRARKLVQPKAEPAIALTTGLFSKLRRLNALKAESARTEADWVSLDRDIRTLEAAYFSPVHHPIANSTANHELDQIFGRWS